MRVVLQAMLSFHELGLPRVLTMPKVLTMVGFNLGNAVLLSCIVNLREDTFLSFE